MRSIRGRLLVGTAFGVSFAFALSGILVVVLARSSLYAQFDEALLARAHAVSALVEEDASVEVELDPAGTPGDVVYVELWAGERVLLRSTNLGANDLVRDPGPLVIRGVELPGGGDGRQITLRFEARREPEDRNIRPPTMVTLVLARPTSEVTGAVDRLAGVLIGVGGFGTLLCLAILVGVVRFGLAPVRSLAEAIAVLREGDLAVRLEAAATPRELRPVVERLDELLHRLAAAFTRERELTAEVAHELRTPLAGLRATLEVSLSRDDRPVEKYRTALADCLAITRQTERLVETMLSLARLDASSAAPLTEPVELDELVREVLAQQAARAAERQLTVITELAPVTTPTDRDKLRLVVHNLVDNAISYADAGGTIRVELAGPTLRITNTGCTLASVDVAHVFERFWRGDAARSAGAHAGLGLALCKKLVTLLGGTITAEVADGRFIATVRI
ncbi:MAG: HAMP domain-containing protein [Myxococcales bacterium]|nr:HAMP domain-containing protein [Myxococcales bacterium]